MKKRDLVNATAVCQSWRSIILSFPSLWCNAGGSPSEIQAYIERSGSMPIVVSLSSPEMAELIAPHTPRLVSLAVQVNDPQSFFDQLAKHLRHPIPTLHTFCLLTSASRPDMVEFDPGANDAFFIHSKKLDLKGIYFRSPPPGPDVKPFLHITEIILRPNDRARTAVREMVDTLEQLPTLERVSVEFVSGWECNDPPRITLPHVQEMVLFSDVQDACIPPILDFVKFPSLTSLLLRIPQPSPWSSIGPAFSPGSFGENLPNLTVLPELQVSVYAESTEFTFRNPTAAFSYVATEVPRDRGWDRVGCRDLPLPTVRRLIVEIWGACNDVGDEWFVEMLRDLTHLEHLELGGRYPTMVERLCHSAQQEGLRLPI